MPRSPVPFPGWLGARTLRIYPWCAFPLTRQQGHSKLICSAAVNPTSRDLKNTLLANRSTKLSDWYRLVQPDMVPLRNADRGDSWLHLRCCTAMACPCAFKLSRDDCYLNCDDCTLVKARLIACHIWLTHCDCVVETAQRCQFCNCSVCTPLLGGQYKVQSCRSRSMAFHLPFAQSLPVIRASFPEPVSRQVQSS